VAAALEETVALERDQVMVDGRGGGQAHGIRDLANGGRISALGHGSRDALEDLLSTVNVVPGQAVTPSGVGGLAGP